MNFPKHAVFPWVLPPLLLVTVLLAGRLNHFPRPFPSLIETLSTTENSLEDFIGISAGIRRLSADLAWIQTLQYYGTPEEGQSEFEFENGMGAYPKFLGLCQRTVRLDPFFIYVYYYGASVLGWNLNQLDAAENLLKEGIRYNPTEWRLHQFLAALAYQKNHDVSNLISFLEGWADDPQCPNVIRSILANLYKKTHQYNKGIRIWTILYQTGDPAYAGPAPRHISELQHLMRLDKHTGS